MIGLARRRYRFRKKTLQANKPRRRSKRLQAQTRPQSSSSLRGCPWRWLGPRSWVQGWDLVVDLWDLFWAVNSRSWHFKSFFADPPDLLQSDRPRFLMCHLISNRASFLCTKAPMVRVPDELFGWHSQDLLASSRHRSMHLLARPGGALSTISTVAKPRTAIVRDIIVSVGICVRNSIICPSWVTWGGASACKSGPTELTAPRRLDAGPGSTADGAQRHANFPLGRSASIQPSRLDDYPPLASMCTL